jgi:hypothetical protein
MEMTGVPPQWAEAADVGFLSGIDSAVVGKTRANEMPQADPGHPDG